MEARSGIEPLYTALQAAASPLCHLARDARNLAQAPAKLILERALPRDRSPDDQLVDALRAFVGHYGLQVEHVPHRAVVQRDPGGSQ